MITILEFFGSAIFCSFILVSIVQMLTKFFKKRAEEKDTVEGLSALTWSEMTKQRGRNATDFFKPIILKKQSSWKDLIKIFLFSFVGTFMVSFGVYVTLLNIDRLYELEDICKPGISSSRSAVREGKVSKTIEGLTIKDTMLERIQTCRDWGFNP